MEGCWMFSTHLKGRQKQRHCILLSVGRSFSRWPQCKLSHWWTEFCPDHWSLRISRWCLETLPLLVKQKKTKALMWRELRCSYFISPQGSLVLRDLKLSLQALKGKYHSFLASPCRAKKRMCVDGSLKIMVHCSCVSDKIGNWSNFGECFFQASFEFVPLVV